MGVIRGFYSSAAGMLGHIERQDAIADNLANCSVPGHKRSSVGFASFSAELVNAGRRLGGSSSTAQCVIPIAIAKRDSRQGELEYTGSNTNFAIDGPGYFVIRTKHGDRLTRSGNFRTDSAGRIVTNDGDPVLGQKGPIQVGPSGWTVDHQGNVLVNGAAIDRIRVVSGPDEPGQKTGRVIQGRLENANVNTVQEMVDMITTLRAYEANQRAVQSLDETLDKIINQAGRTA